MEAEATTDLTTLSQVTNLTTTIFLPSSTESLHFSSNFSSNVPTSAQYSISQTPDQPRNSKSIQIFKSKTSAVTLIWSIVGACVILTFLGLGSLFAYRNMPARKRAQPDYEMSTLPGTPIKSTENFEGCRIVNYIEQPNSSLTLKNSYNSNPEIKNETQE